jgi:hypothetical protein
MAAAIRSMACLILFVGLGGPSQADVMFSDGTFDDADWSGSVLASVGGTSFSSSQTAAGGNPNAFRQLQHTYGGNGSIFTGHLRDGAIYDPATQGAVASISLSFDLIGFDFGASNAVSYQALLFQNGFYYSSSEFRLIQAPSDQWKGFDLSDLEAADFFRLNGSGETPDFSATGALIQFGYSASNGTGNNQQTMTDSGIDNWSVRITSVPEPSSFFFLGLVGFLKLGFSRCKNQRFRSQDGFSFV